MKRFPCYVSFFVYGVTFFFFYWAKRFGMALGWGRFPGGMFFGFFFSLIYPFSSLCYNFLSFHGHSFILPYRAVVLL